MAFLIGFGALSVLCGWLAWRIAEAKGRSGYLWGLSTVLFLVPLIILLTLPDKPAANPI